MILSERKKYNYLIEEEDLTIAKIRDKYERKPKKTIKRTPKVRIVFMILLLSSLCALQLIQHSKVNTINREIINLEAQVKDVQMLNDSKEGMILSSLDLEQIEKTAKDKLGMVEPTEEQFSYLAVRDSSEDASETKSASNSETNDDKALVWLSRLID